MLSVIKHRREALREAAKVAQSTNNVRGLGLRTIVVSAESAHWSLFTKLIYTESAIRRLMHVADSMTHGAEAA